MTPTADTFPWRVDWPDGSRCLHVSEESARRCMKAHWYVLDGAEPRMKKRHSEEKADG